MVKAFSFLVGLLVAPTICFGQGRFSGGPGRGDASALVLMQSATEVQAYPNPAKCGEVVRLSRNAENFDVFTINGLLLTTKANTFTAKISGVYMLKTKNKWLKLVMY